MQETPIRRGDVLWADWNPGRGSEQRGQRPAVVIQNDVGNQYSPTTIVAAITSRAPRRYPILVPVQTTGSGLRRNSFVNTSQILTIDRSRVIRKIGSLDRATMGDVDRAIRVSLGLDLA